MRYVVTISLLIGAVIHLLPLPGILGAARLESLYGVPLTEPNLIILMRHRAVLFGLLGTFLLVAVFKPALQPLAFTAGLISVVSFLWFAALDSHNASIGRVVAADVVALIALLLGTAAYAYTAAKL
jgi:hypothetical protein